MDETQYQPIQSQSPQISQPENVADSGININSVHLIQTSSYGKFTVIIIFLALLQFFGPLWLILFLPTLSAIGGIRILGSKPVKTGTLAACIFSLAYTVVGYIGTLILPPDHPLIGGVIDADVVLGVIAYIFVATFLGLVTGFIYSLLHKDNVLVSVQDQQSAQMPWPWRALLVFSVVFGLPGSVLINWQELKRLNLNSHAKKILYIGIAVLIILFFLIVLTDSIITVGSLSQGLAALLAWSTYSSYLRKWQMENPGKAKFDWAIMKWGFAGLAGYMMFVLIIIFGQYLFSQIQPSDSVTLPYEHRVVVQSPREKMEQIIGHNVVFTQLNSYATPVFAVDENHDDAIQTLLTVNSTLDESATLNIRGKTIMTLTGVLQESPVATPAAVTLKTAMTTLTGQDGVQSITDLIMNGSIGNARLQDESQDALHVSHTQTDINNNFLKINMSDYLLIFVNRMMHPGDPVTAQVSVDTDKIWPFLGQYLHIPRDLEEMRFGRNLPDDELQKLTDINSEIDTIYSQTLANAESYADISTTPESDGTTTVTALLHTDKLAVVLVKFLAGSDAVLQEYKIELADMCRQSDQTEEQTDNCLDAVNSPAWTDEEVQAHISAFLSPLTFSPITARIDSGNFSIRKLTFDVTFTNTKQDEGSSLWNIPLPLSTFTLHIDTEEVSRMDNSQIIAPLSSVGILEAGDNTKTFLDDSYQEQSIQGNLYRENKKNLLGEAYTASKTYCAGTGTQEYCIDAPEIWLEFTNSTDTENRLSFTKKNPDPNDYRNMSISITQSKTAITPIECLYDLQTGSFGTRMATYHDITTRDNILLRISREQPQPTPYENEYYWTCSGLDGRYFQTTPYGAIVINPGSSSFEEAVKEVSAILGSLRLKNSDVPATISIAIPSPWPTASYSFDKNPFRYKTGNTSIMELYGVQSPGDPGVCNTKSTYLEQQYQLDPGTVIAVPDSFGVCLSQTLCAVCANGDLGDPTGDLSACNNQPCNP